MGASQLWQSHLTPPAPGMDPGQQKMMRWMPLLFIGIFYRMSSGLNLYYTVSNLLTIAQTKITKMGPDPAAGPAKLAAARAAEKEVAKRGRLHILCPSADLLNDPKRIAPPMAAQPKETLTQLLKLLGFEATVEEHPP
jgi:hypothetical protein